jgi:hypothetical protein
MQASGTILRISYPWQRVYEAKTLEEIHMALEEAGRNLQQLQVFRKLHMLVYEEPVVRFWFLIACTFACTSLLIRVASMMPCMGRAGLCSP